jgi:hypothetical protein
MREQCKNYFSDHIAKDKFFSFSDDEQCAAIKTAATDLATCGVTGITRNSPEMLRFALFEQTIFILCRKDEYVNPARELVSESIDGVGSCRYLPNGCPPNISLRAYNLIEAFFRMRSTHFVRG